MSIPKLTSELQEASYSNQVDQVYQLLRICDLIHSGHEVPNYTVADLPSDADYEFFKNKHNYQTDTSITESTIMYMSTIPKEKEIVEIQNAIIMAKYDGVSAAILFTRTGENVFTIKAANTRGSTTGTTISTTDLKPKLDNLVDHIKFNEAAFKSAIAQRNPPIPTEFTILNIAIRGELILNRRTINEITSQTLNHPASIVAGMVNGGMAKFNEGIDRLCLQFYEIAYVDVIDSSNQIQKIVPTQYETVMALTSCFIYYKYIKPEQTVVNPQKALDSKIYTAENTLHISFNSLYEDLLRNIHCPTDGLVYCSQNWTYPQNKEAFGKRTYGKHAWKPTNSCYSNVVDIQWPITKNGELNPIVQFNEFSFNGTKYSQCKVSMGQLIEFQQHGFGIGAEISISIVNLKTAHIDEVIQPAPVAYTIPTKCPYCNSPLILEDGKAVKGSYVPKHLKCVSKNCIKQKIQKYAYFLTSLSKLCPNLVFKNKNGNVVKAKISEKKLDQICAEHGDINNDILQVYVPNFLTALDSLTHENQLVILSFGGIKQVQALIKERKSTSWRDYNIPWFK